MSVEASTILIGVICGLPQTLQANVRDSVQYSRRQHSPTKEEGAISPRRHLM
jgi:hypothetical protein